MNLETLISFDVAYTAGAGGVGTSVPVCSSTVCGTWASGLDVKDLWWADVSCVSGVERYTGYD